MNEFSVLITALAGCFVGIFGGIAAAQRLSDYKTRNDKGQKFSARKNKRLR